jgi:hypothetical protein
MTERRQAAACCSSSWPQQRAGEIALALGFDERQDYDNTLEPNRTD